MRVAAVFPVGTSESGCPAAIAEILKKEHAVEVYLLYGRRGASDAADPKDFVARIREVVVDERVTWAGVEEVEPFHFSETYEQVRGFIGRLSEVGYDRVWVGITGSTNPIVASLFQIAMAYLACQVIPVYVQARGATPVQHFVASDVRDRVLAEEVLATARIGQVRVAGRLAERLPLEGDGKFLRLAVKGLAHWDDFDYKAAIEDLKVPARTAGDYANGGRLSLLASTVMRLNDAAAEMTALAKAIRDTNGFAQAVAKSGWAEQVKRGGLLLVADVLANAKRRIIEGRFTDSVLRSYRAAESATQMRLLLIGIHPSKADACPEAYAKYHLGETPLAAGGLAFSAGLKFLNEAGVFDAAPIRETVKDLSSARNYTYLEHGYVRVDRSQAEGCFEKSLSICEHLLGASVRDAWPQLEMGF